jgi:3'-phosphoadenosine 5'-phosphosulfate sulfotransferase (PAPS reductase)/FAD synthetase
MNHIVAISGGKDSTALALRLAEIEPRDYTYLITPTGDELPDMVAHWENLENLLGKKFLRITNHDLNFWIEEFGALPNWRQRWCTQAPEDRAVPCLRQREPTRNDVRGASRRRGRTPRDLLQ